MNRDQVAAALRSSGSVFAEDEAGLILEEAESTAALMAMVARRMAGEPLEQIVGWAEFRHLRIAVEPGVFVPRARSGLLVDEALRLGGRRAVDLCCGSGALGAALLAELPGVSVLATDLDPAAVHCARRNLPPERVRAGDLYDALPPEAAGTVDLLVVNAPYVPTDDIATMPPEARDHEHRMALDGGPDGLDLHRRVAAGAPAWLAPRGHLLVETSRRQARATADAMTAAGLATRLVTDDDLDATVVVGRRSHS